MQRVLTCLIVCFVVVVVLLLFSSVTLFCIFSVPNLFLFFVFFCFFVCLFFKVFSKHVFSLRANKKTKNQGFFSFFQNASFILFLIHRLTFLNND